MMARKPLVVKSFVDAADYDQRYGVVEEIMREFGKIPKLDDLVVQMRMLGSALVSIESPCQKVVESDSTSDEARILAVSVIEQIEAVRDRLASLVVNLRESQQAAKIAESDQ